ncbi:ABC transporter substrate-binding protein [bacterium]|nr:MAG: ABC transporter substrate-binding protein [bacterium]
MRRFALLLIFGLFLSGCSQAPREPGVLHLAQQSDASTLDPAKSYDTTSIQWVRLLYRGMVNYDSKANIVNELAEKREISPDGKTYTFWIRKGVRYHDGSPVRATDFRYAIERVTDPATASDGQSFFNTIVGSEAWIADRKENKKLQHISGIEVVNDNKIVFHLTRPDATFLNYLALPFAFPVSQDWVKKVGQKVLSNASATPEEIEAAGSDALSENPNGCGPYKLEEWVHDGWLNLVKNPNYFQPSVPKNNRIEVRFGIASTLQIMLFEQGQLDIIGISDAFPPEFQRLTKQDPWQKGVMHRPTMDIRYLSLNTELEPFKDVRVRRAFNYAINVNRIVSLQSGRAMKARGALPPGMPAYNPKLFQYEYDPKKAKALLTEAGFYKKSLKITLDYSDGENWYSKAAESIRADLQAVGVDVILKKGRYSEVKTKAGSRKKSQMAMLGWLQDFPDPSNFLDICFNSNKISNEASINRAFYSNPKVDALLNAGAIETDREKRLNLYRQAEEQIVQDAPWVFMVHTERYIVQQSWVKGFEMNAAWAAIYENVTVD